MSHIPETSLGGRDRAFPSTQWSVIREAGARDAPHRREALENLCRIYWKPVYSFLRSARRLTNEEAKDSVQDFFVELLEGTLLQRFSPDLGSFRSYLRGALHYFLLNRHERDAAQKRGGGRKILNLDDVDAPPQPEADAEEAFDREWATSVIEPALAALQKELEGEGKSVYYRAFEAYEFPPPGAPVPTYAAIGASLGLKETDVTNYLHFCRRRLRRLLEERILDYVAGSDDVPAELAQVLSSLAGGKG